MQELQEKHIEHLKQTTLRWNESASLIEAFSLRCDELTRHVSELELSRQQELHEARDELGKAMGEITILTERASVLTDQLSSSDAQCKSLKHQLASMEAVHQEEIAKYQAEIATLHHRESQRMRELQAGSDARVSLQQELAALQVDFERQLTAGIEARTRHLAEEVQHMTAARDNAVEQLHDKEAENKSLADRIRQITEQLVEVDSERKSFKHQLNIATSAHTEVTQRLTRTSSEVALQADRITLLTNKLSAAKADRKALKQQLVAAKSQCEQQETQIKSTKE